MFLLVIDAHSKWLEVIIVPSITAKSTVEKLRSIFATHGLPETIVSDNGPAFVSEEFQRFVQRNGIKHIRTAPYHPASNGQVERAVQVFKEGIKRSTAETLETQVSRFLFHYRTTPHTTTVVTPAELLMGRQLRTHLNLIHPDIAAHVQQKQERQRAGQHKRAKERTVTVGEQVYVRTLPTGTSWIPGVVREQRGPKSYLVELNNGCVFRRHIDHIRHRATNAETTGEEQLSEKIQSLEDIGVSREAPQVATQESLPSDIGTASPVDTQTTIRRSTRVRNPPLRYTPSHSSHNQSLSEEECSTGT